MLLERFVSAVNGIKYFFDKIKDSENDKKRLFAMFSNLCIYYATYIKSKNQEGKGSRESRRKSFYRRT